MPLLDPDHPGRCKARVKTGPRAGKQCGKMAITGRQVCSTHGGRSASGITHAHFKDGRAVKSMPKRLLDNYRDSLDDPELLNLSSEIAVIDARISDMLSRADQGDGSSAWAQAQLALKEFRAARRRQSIPEQEDAIAHLELAIGQARSDYAAWDDVQRLIVTRAKLVETERKRLSDMNQLITAEQALMLLNKVVEVVKRHVAEKNILNRIADDIRIIAVGAPHKETPPGRSIAAFAINPLEAKHPLYAQYFGEKRAQLRAENADEGADAGADPPEVIDGG